MRGKIYFLLRYYLFWVGISVVAKIVFLLYQGGKAFELSAEEYARVFFRGLRLDLSLGGYIIMLSCVILAFTPYLKERMLRYIFNGLTGVLLFFYSLVMTVDLELFKNWGYHINTTPLLYINTPGEAMASTPDWLIAGLLLLMLSFIAFFYYIYHRFVVCALHYRGWNWQQVPVFLLIGGVMLIPVRGGFNVAPMNSSFVFFHRDNMFANQAAVNPVWNFMYEVTHIHKFKNNYHFMPQERAEHIVDSLHKTGTIFPHVLKTQRPNIVFLLLESFTANAIEVLGGAKGVTPNLNELAKEGILFSNIYATGGRSDRGIIAAISAFPSHPDVAMIKYPDKTIAHPRFPKDLENHGYHTRFYYAGDINFGSFRSYITMSFQEFVTEDDFSGEAKGPTFKWGIHDEYMFNRFYEDVSRAPFPFMYMAFNMSSHEPFEVPMPTQIKGSDSQSKFLNAIYYSDRCIGDFIKKCKQSDIWDSTLFVLMADHGTRAIGNLDPASPAAYRIPLIFTGGVLNVKDTVISVIGSQTDMVATLFAQLGIDYSGYKYSKNLLATDVVPFAFYSYSDAACFISDKGESIYNLKSRQYVVTDSCHRNDELVKAYLQSVDHEQKKTLP